MPEAIGIDIGGTHLRAARVEAGGLILAEARRPCDRRPEAVLRDVVALVAELRTPDVAALGRLQPARVRRSESQPTYGAVPALIMYLWALAAFPRVRTPRTSEPRSIRLSEMRRAPRDT